MSVLDIVLAVLILFGLVRGLMNGFFVEIASLIALVAGVYGAIHFSNYAATLIDENSQWDEKTVNIVAFAVTFLIIVLVIALAGKALTKLADFAALGIVNKLLGALFGALKVAVILSVFLNVFDSMNRAIPLTDDDSVKDSVLYAPVKSLIPMIFPIILEKKKELEKSSEDEPLTPDQSV
ncbi:membrane protein required for colicin V production [Gelidibacter algens]|jgi:membrane protein required for colicin V production|uniref:Membrane protein required for colicin V production n=1 Tax=Gelidibacter algens TaxID=49280 RepID=A0A1A7R252_9FLAO|nr:CvpA family protein [Gelidibacter algens]OBX26340.1 colicin V production protein [Gelidibacter algens]RAJ25848.1 membrane protein required for colicin V production [Gelidibacter algens]